jgi:serine/threonine-protein kinase
MPERNVGYTMAFEAHLVLVPPTEPAPRNRPREGAYTPISVDREPDRELGPGAVLADRYRLVRRIGGGGMGSVWEGEHVALATPVAIKLINPSLVDDERARSRFLREARAAANLRSPHVVHTHDYGVHQGTPYIAMELLSGETLADRLARARVLPPEAVLELVAQIGRAVGKAHEQGLVHRDLKPDNIFLVPTEHGDVAKVLDFGIVKQAAESALDATTKSGAMLGTPYYMSPEQLVDAALADARSDLWSLAVITYECLLGERPFVADTMPELAVAVLAEAPPVPSRRGAVPAGFDAWFARATQREPDARYRDVTEMIEALADALRDDVDVAPRSSSAARDLGRGHARWMIALGVVGVAAVVAIAITQSRDAAPADAPPARDAHEPDAAPADPPPVQGVLPVPVPTPAPSETAPPGEAKAASPPPSEAKRTRPTKPRPAKAETKHDLDELEP